jgi:heptosyltransferase III
MTRRVSSLHRLLDRTLGIPLVSLLAVLPKRRPPDPAAIRRIGVLKTAAIGDTLLLCGILEPIRRRFPNAQLVLVTGGDNAAVAALLDGVDEHVVIRPDAPLSSLRAVRHLDLDVILDCGPWPRFDALLASLSRARYRVGFRVPGQARHYGFDAVVEHSSMIHQCENLQNLARAVGVTEFAPPSVRRPGALSAERRPAGPVAVFHPWSGGYMGHVKEWSEDRWVELAGELAGRYRVRILVSGAPGDARRSRALVRRISESGCDAQSIAGEYSLVELADILAASDLVVSVNTGVMHLAALLGAPTVSLEGPVAPHRWKPIGPRTRSVVTTLPGCGYLDLGFEYAGRRLDCMNGVTVGAVLAAAHELLGSPVNV